MNLSNVLHKLILIQHIFFQLFLLDSFYWLLVMATGGGPFEEGMNDQDLPSWSNESLDDRLNNTV